MNLGWSAGAAPSSAMPTLSPLVAGVPPWITVLSALAGGIAAMIAAAFSTPTFTSGTAFTTQATAL